MDSEEILAGMEAQLMAKLVTLAKAEKVNREAMEENLYLLHQEMSGNGREGKFSAFVRENMGWQVQKPYDKAMRWIAKYQHRTGLITPDEYRRRMGKSPSAKSTPRRGTSQDNLLLGVRPAAPAVIQQTFTVIDDDDGDAEADLRYTDDKLAESAAELERRHSQGDTCLLLRTVMTAGERDWYRAAERMQMRRHGVKSRKDAFRKVMFLGRKAADEDDEWGQIMDEILREVDTYPALMDAPDREED